MEKSFRKVTATPEPQHVRAAKDQLSSLGSSPISDNTDPALQVDRRVAAPATNTNTTGCSRATIDYASLPDAKFCKNIPTDFSIGVELIEYFCFSDYSDYDVRFDTAEEVASEAVLDTQGK